MLLTSSMMANDHMTDSTSKTQHIPVLLEETIEGLDLAPGKVVVDGTLGGGGHAVAIARKVGSSGLVIGTDRDPSALERLDRRIAELGEPLNLKTYFANYCDFDDALERAGVERVDGFLLDLGLSSDQLADRSRGFSFDSDGELDLRYDTTEGEPAYKLLNRWKEEKIADVIFKYGEDRLSRRIARAVVERRRQEPIRYARELAEICRRCDPTPPWSKKRIDPATRTFQALRIVVNDELGSLETFLKKFTESLKVGGRVAIISFHSLEDRIVKNAFRDSEGLRILTKKPIVATDEEVERNPRARSAKLRIAERIN
ncbi:MAG: 16S rRNA (cytosine(1402)-N(4))-methyltransferase RsmH [Thermoguttaceae bacterium]|nr:16S rRNA (cytosine(1402)-N(4))-methyltransferase RsmH [Thermoguttaceae bacterium]